MRPTMFWATFVSAQTYAMTNRNGTKDYVPVHSSVPLCRVQNMISLIVVEFYLVLTCEKQHKMPRTSNEAPTDLTTYRRQTKDDQRWGTVVRVSWAACCQGWRKRCWSCGRTAGGCARWTRATDPCTLNSTAA